MDDSRKEALRLRLGGLSYRQIGQALGLSRQRAQQLISPPTAVRQLVVSRAKGLCEGCELHVGKSGHVHHKNSANGDTYNDMENLQLLCLGCHSQAHGYSGPKAIYAPPAERATAIVCNACGHRWIARVAKPRRCPNCTSTTWDKPRPESEE